MKSKLSLILSSLLICFTITAGPATTVTMFWQAVPDARVNGFRVYEQIGTNWTPIALVSTNYYTMNVMTNLHIFSVTSCSSTTNGTNVITIESPFSQAVQYYCPQSVLSIGMTNQ